MPILANQFPIFKPAMRVISNITNAKQAEVTTTFAHGYINGIVLRLIIPLGYGMVQANQLFGSITVTGETTFTITIDTTYFTPYTTPDVVEQYCQCVPFGEISSSLYAPLNNVLPY